MRSMFGDCDRKNGKKYEDIVNTNPLWTKKKQIEDMKESVAEIEKQEENNMFINAKVRATKRARKAKIQATLSQIEDSDPRGKIKGKDLDSLNKVVTRFVEEVKNLNPTHHDNDQAVKSGKSNINPSRQVKYSKSPCIQLKTGPEIEAAKACNLKIDENNMVSRDDMTRAIWMLQPVLGEQPDHLKLRRDAPVGHIRQASQILVGDLPPDMQVAHEKFVKELRAKNATSMATA